MAISSIDPITPRRHYKRIKRVRNPFHHGGPVPPESFIGHQKAVDFCYVQLTNERPTNIAINGERRIGKTSLLHYLKIFGTQEAWGQHLCLFLDIGIFGGTFKSTTFWSEVFDLLQGELEPTPSIVAQITHLKTQSPPTSKDFRQLLNNYYQLYPEQSIILLIDEFELILETNHPDDIREVLISLNSLTRLPTHKFTLITATRDPLSQVCDALAQTTSFQFYSNFVPCQLKPFDEVETRHVVQTLLARTDVEFTSQELDYIWKISQVQRGGAHPIFVQVAASLIFEVKQNDQSPIDYSHLDRKFEEQTRLYQPGGSGPKTKPPTPPSIFISYSHKDEQEKDELLSHLGVLQNAGLIDIWSDERIGAGEDWETEIDQAITKAKVAILLISANFLTSKFILQKEVPELLKRRDKEDLTVFPVIAKACAWKAVDWLTKMNVRPKNGKPVWSDAGSHVDEDLAVIAEEVAGIVKRGYF